MTEPIPTPPRIEVAGENAFIVYFGEQMSGVVADRVQLAVRQVRHQLAGPLIDLIPSYASLLVIYDTLQIGPGKFRAQLEACLAKSPLGEEASKGRAVMLPVYYAPEAGPDLAAMAVAKGLSVAEVIRLHHAPEYRVYAIGFAPGFAFLGEVDERLATPRLTTPRARVPRGAVGIADRQTAVYPSETPGGWNLIGRCPVRMFDPAEFPSMPVAVGDRVRFEPINHARYLELGGEPGGELGGEL